MPSAETPSTGGEEDKLLQCFECPESEGLQIFATEEDLMMHKWDKIMASKAKSHMKCHICDRVHHTFEGLLRHYQLNHPVQQKLKCPCCEMQFGRVTQMMKHLEYAECPNVERDRVGNNRITKAIEASESADTTSLSELGIFTLGAESVGDFGRYIGIHSHLGPMALALGGVESGPQGTLEQSNESAYGWDTGTANSSARPAAGPGAIPAVMPSATSAATTTALARFANVGSHATKDFRRGDSKAPDLLTDDASPMGRLARNPSLLGNTILRPGQASTGGTYSLSLSNPMGGRLSTLQDHQGNQSHNQSQKQNQTENPKELAGPQFNTRKAREFLDPDHPDSPKFNVSKYRNRYSEKYNCPHLSCQRSGKSFKTEKGLVNHLRSNTAHSSLRVMCPSCFHYFHTIHALLQHCESQTTRCHFRHSDEFQPFMDILTGGVADVKGYNVDLTIEYGVNPNASKQLLDGGKDEASIAPQNFLEDKVDSLER